MDSVYKTYEDNRENKRFRKQRINDVKRESLDISGSIGFQERMSGDRGLGIRI
jgi:hypothetical protein